MSITADIQPRKVEQRKDRIDFTELLRAVIKDAPNRYETFHRATLKSLLKQIDYEEYLDDALDRIISLEYGKAFRSVFPPTKAELKKTASKIRSRNKEDDAAVDVIKSKIASRLLDFVMPNGKPLRSSTGKECADAGGWFAKIAKAVKPNQKVGAVLDEAQVRKLFGTTA